MGSLFQGSQDGENNKATDESGEPSDIDLETSLGN
jgi:hypothetical protein